MTTRLIVSIAVFILGVALGWYAGIDYTQRGFVQAFCVAYSVILAGFTYTCPMWPKEQPK